MTGFLLSSLKINKIKDFVFYLLILFIPTQLGRHFWPEFSFIKGVRIDYLSPTLYVTDMLILLIFVFWIFSKSKFLISNFPPALAFGKSRWRAGKFLIKSKFSKSKLAIFIFVLFLIIGIVSSKSPAAGFFGLIRLLGFVFLGFYTAKNINALKLQNVLLMFSLGIVFESFLAISQYFNHGSINGIFYFFGERFFNSLTPGIANASLGGELFLRPYGTFPHPNVLAGYLVIGMTLISSKFKVKSSKLRKIFYCVALLIGTVAIFLTLSRVAILLWVVILGFVFVRRFIKTKSKISIFYLLFSIFALGVVSFLLINSPLGSRFTELKLTDESIAQRESLIQSSILMIKDSPMVGVGLNNFLINLPYYQESTTPLFYLQPVHNLFLLILSEIGITGFLFVLWFMFRTAEEMRRKKEFQISNFKFQILLTVFVLGMFDHYFLTLQQGQLLFSLILGLCWSDKLKN